MKIDTSSILGVAEEGLRTQSSSLPRHYMDLLEHACEDHPPCFGMQVFGDRFRELALNRAHFAVQQLNSAVEECFGARRLLELISELPDNKFSLGDLFLLHAKEEVHHSHLLIDLLELVFPDVTANDELVEQIRLAKPEIDSETDRKKSCVSLEEVLTEIVQINIGELRNLIQLRLAKPLLISHCSIRENQAEVARIMDTLISDECRHVHYTAVLVNKYHKAGHANQLSLLMDRAIVLFDEESRMHMWPRGEMPV